MKSGDMIKKIFFLDPGLDLGWPIRSKGLAEVYALHVLS